MFVRAARQTMPAPPAEGRVRWWTSRFAGGDNYEKSTVPFLQALGERLAIWVDTTSTPVGWSRSGRSPVRAVCRTGIAHACPSW